MVFATTFLPTHYTFFSNSKITFEKKTITEYKQQWRITDKNKKKRNEIG
jgi:hypothetical protein